MVILCTAVSLTVVFWPPKNGSKITAGGIFSSRSESSESSNSETATSSYIAASNAGIASPIERNSSVAKPQSESAIIKTQTIPRWFAPGSVTVRTFQSGQIENQGAGYSARYIYINDLYAQPGHSGCTAPRFDIATGEISCVNHEIYEAVKGKLTQFESPQNVYVFQDFSTDYAAVFININSSGNTGNDPNYYIYLFETKTFIKSPYALNDGFWPFLRTGQSY
jgi:hypothetical protein